MNGLEKSIKKSNCEIEKTVKIEVKLQYMNKKHHKREGKFCSDNVFSLKFIYFNIPHNL